MLRRGRAKLAQTVYQGNMTDQFSWMVFLVGWKYGELKALKSFNPLKSFKSHNKHYGSGFPSAILYLPETRRILSTLWARKTKRRADGWIKYTPHTGILFLLSHGGWRHQLRHIRTLAFGALWGWITGRHQEHFKAVRTVFTLIFVNRHHLLRKKLMGNLNLSQKNWTLSSSW